MNNKEYGLYCSKFEFDSCGVGFIANIKGEQSFQIVSDAITMLENMEHRGATGYESNTGDGAGIQIQIPHKLLSNEVIHLGINLPKIGNYAVGILCFPKNIILIKKCKKIFEKIAYKLNFNILGYRSVPVDNSFLGKEAKKVEPIMEMVFIEKPLMFQKTDLFERKLFILKKYATHEIFKIINKDNIGFYIMSLSSRNMIYKGQLRSIQIRDYFLDLKNEKLASSFGIVHSRFATNTTPSWFLAQPFNCISHNGEINTINGNINWIKSNEKNFKSSLFSEEELNMILPLIQESQSDSACLDNIIEILIHSGISLPKIMMMLVPEAWHENPNIKKYKKYFYEFYSCIMEPWDGPAFITFTDGKIIGSILDRNGLRPSRFCITSDNRIIMASESGTLNIDSSKIIEKGQLSPGEMMIIDLIEGRIINNEEIKKNICFSKPYKNWIKKNKINLNELAIPNIKIEHFNKEQVFKNQKKFGYTSEDINIILKNMATSSKEPIGSMGLDIPLAVLSKKPQHLSAYFKQLFAQVTNPPIDSIRERSVMSLINVINGNHNLLMEYEKIANCIILEHPVLTNIELYKLKYIEFAEYKVKILTTHFKIKQCAGNMEKALEKLCESAINSVKDGVKIIILSDKLIDRNHISIPSLLACSAVHHKLIEYGIRGKIGIIIEAGDVWEVHHFSTLISFGATAINPYLAFDSIENLYKSKEILGNLLELKNNYIKSINDGLLKIFSKIGISTLQSYHGSKTFEIVGIHQKVINKYFPGTTSRISGLDLDNIEKEILQNHYIAYNNDQNNILENRGIYQWRDNGEYHMYNPNTIHLLQEATRTKNYQLFKKYTKIINNENNNSYSTIRSLLKFQNDRPSISIEEVEPIQNILKRFSTGAMSFGSISFEAHSTLAIAMNNIGGKSNTGEGGEDESRYTTLINGKNMKSAIKQIASGRFGVTSRYLSEADELQIKMAQGAKPGEGGQLSGDKIDDWIAKTRYSIPGVGLISPPPHHDIYSIEDLAQLIFDLKNANRHARISVKLVAKAGIGTIASGVVKAKAEHILISGHDGGTGAASLSSIRYAGLPWELGLVETHQTLIKNQLRQRVRIQTDGQIKTGRDIIIATLLGAEEWGVATSALIVLGCVLMRKCHLNICPVGIATQNSVLRKKFLGNPNYLINYFNFLAYEIREIMANLGFKTINELVGQYQCLIQKKDINHWKFNNLNLDFLLQKIESHNLPVYQTEDQNHDLNNSISWKMLEVSQNAIKNKTQINVNFNIKNTDRSVGTIVSHEVTKKYHSQGMPHDSLVYKFRGVAGQSFGAFCTKGISMFIEGEANDYFGKGLSGAKLIVYPDRNSTLLANKNSIIGNVALYGATSGYAFINGIAGQRFCVRNSGSTSVVEGIGDHGCEYMTGGTVLILGHIGHNFGAGMSGGIAYIWDIQKQVEKNINPDMIDVKNLNKQDYNIIKILIKDHYNYTKSKLANLILKNKNKYWKYFKKIIPKKVKIN